MECLIFLSILCFFIRTLQCNNTDLTCSFENNFCGWTNEGWLRKRKSQFTTSGPSLAKNGVYYIQINTTKLNHIFTIKADFQKPSGTSCLKFCYHLYGKDVEYLRYGYYTGTTRHMVKTITRRENFWHCSTFDLFGIPISAEGIYFEAKSGSTPYSIIGLDAVEFLTGNVCSNTEYPIATTPVPTTQKIESTTAGQRRTPDSNDKWYIIGGVCGGLVLLATIIIIVCILKTRKRDNKNILHFPTDSQQNRALPAVPQYNTQNQEEVVLSIAESFDRKFSVKPATSYAKHFTESKQVLTLAGDYTGESKTELVTRVNNIGESDYIPIPPAYDTDDEHYIALGDGPDHISSLDDDYLFPSVEIEPIRGNTNQYESDPTKKRETKITNECGESSANEICAVKIPSIPVMRNCNASTQENDTSDDYDDAEIALIKDGISRQKTEDGIDNTGYNSEDSANGGEGSPGNDTDDYLEVNNATDDEYEEPTNDNHSLENPNTTVMRIVSKTTQEEDNNSDKNNALAIPKIPHNQGERIVMSLEKSFDKNASLTPVSFYTKNSIKSKQVLTLSGGNTGEDETELVNEVKSDGESDYFLKPPDYDTDDDNYITPGDGPDNSNSQDDDYLYPSVGIEPMIRAKENPYISDLTEKGEVHTYTHTTTIHEECNEPVNAIRALKIPTIPVVRNGNVITQDNDSSDEYDDAEIAVLRDGINGNEHAGYNSEDSANGGKCSPGNDTDDYLEINDTTDDEYEEPVNSLQNNVGKNGNEKTQNMTMIKQL